MIIWDLGEKGMGKYLFFDIDGTLAGRSRRITEKTRWAVREARKRGHKVFLCTGRVPASIVGDAAELEVDGIISGAGSFVKVNGEYVFEHFMEPSLTRQVMDLFEKNGLLFTLETRDVIYQTPGAREFFTERSLERIRDNPELMRYHEQINRGEHLKPVSEFDRTKTKVAKMCYIAEEKEGLNACVPFLKKYFNIVIFSKEEDSFVNGEIILKGCTKGDAVRWIMKYLHGDMKDTIGFGDSMNDYQMLETVETGVVYEGAPEKVKKLAHSFFGEPDEDGIYKVMVQLGLIDEMKEDERCLE